MENLMAYSLTRAGQGYWGGAEVPESQIPSVLKDSAAPFQIPVEGMTRCIALHRLHVVQLIDFPILELLFKAFAPLNQSIVLY